MKNLTTPELISLIISGLAFFVALLSMGLAIYIYYVHDSKLKKQEWLINNNQLRKINEDELHKLKAHIYIVKESLSDSLFFIKVTNDGFADAKRLEMKIVQSEHVTVLNNDFPLEILKSGESEKFKIMITDGIQKFIELKFKWIDDSLADRESNHRLNF